MGGWTWTPDAVRADATAMAAFLRAAADRSGSGLASTPQLHAWSVADPGAFWRLVWDQFGVVGEPGEVAYEPTTMPRTRFFPEARVNLAENLLARWHDSDEPALVWVGESAQAAEGPVVRGVVSGRELCERVGAFAGWLEERGVGRGDRVGLVLPVGPHAVVATLGALAVGAVVSSVAPEFGAAAIIERFGQLDPAVLVVATTYRWSGAVFDRRQAVTDVVSGLSPLRGCVVVDSDDAFAAISAAAGAGAVRIDDVLAHARATGFAATTFDDPAYILFSSGTTGKPKCLVHRGGGVLLKHCVELGLHADVRAGDRLLFYTTTSWMMWNWQLSALALGASIVLYDGAPTYPDATALFEAACLTRATHLGVAARLLDHLRTADSDLGGALRDAPLREILVTGSPLSVATAEWIARKLGPDVMINPISGGTDLVGCFVGGDPTRPFRAGEMTGPILGTAVDVYTDDGVRAADGEAGELVCLQPFPTVPVGIWGDETGQRLRSTYFVLWPGTWVHGDRAVRSAEGGIAILGRSDATLNIGGVRIGTAEIYSALADHPAVEESLAFGQEWDGDLRIVLLVTAPPGVVVDAAAVESIRATIRAACSPRHVPAAVLAVPDLPRTQTGKLSELAVREAVHGRAVPGRSSLANPEALDLIVAVVAGV